MIPVPQPHSARPPRDGDDPAADQEAGGQYLTAKASSVSTDPPRRPRRRLTIAMIASGAAVLIVVAGLVIADAVFDVDPLFIVLTLGVIICLAASGVVRFMLASLPGAKRLRSIFNALALVGVAAVVYLFVYPSIQSGSLNWLPRNGMHAVGAAGTVPASVVFTVTGSAPKATIAYTPDTGDSTDASVARPLPFTVTETSKNTLFTLRAKTSNAPENSTITCTITINGTVVATDSDEGSSGSVLCMGNAANAPH